MLSSIRGHLLRSFIIVGSQLAGCASAPMPPAATAVADVAVSYKGVPISQSRIATPLNQAAQVDTTLDDGHTSTLKLTIADDGAGNYRTTVDVTYDGATLASTGLLSAPGQSAVIESADVKLMLRVSAGT